MKKREFTTFLLALAMFSTALVSCGENAIDTPASDTEPLTPLSETEAVTDDGRIPSSLPEKDLDGFVMTMFQSTDGPEKGVFAETLTGDPVNDVVYQRNNHIMEKYNCVIEQHTSNEKYIIGELKTYILAGDDTIDTALACGVSVTGNLWCFMDLADLPYFDFKQPWWSEEFNEGIMINGHLYFTLGAMNISARSSMFGTVVNKKVAANLDIAVESLYNAARNGKWTLDMLGSFAKMGSRDLDGNGVLDESDQWGILGQNYSNWSLALGSGFRCMTRDKDGAFVYNFGCEKNVSIMEKVLGYTTDSSVTIMAQEMKTSNVWQTYITMSQNGQFLFLVSNITDAFRAFDFDYGFLPIPKFDEQQTRYYHDGSLGNNRLIVIPQTCSSPENTAFLLEAMNYESYYDVLPTFYQDFLNTKLLRDTESVEMMQIVQDSIYYDCGAFYDWGGMRMTIEDMIKSGENRLASVAAKQEAATMKAIEKTLATLEENS